MYNCTVLYTFTMGAKDPTRFDLSNSSSGLLQGETIFCEHRFYERNACISMKIVTKQPVRGGTYTPTYMCRTYVYMILTCAYSHHW